MGETVILEGWLLKQGAWWFSTWQQRWFSLRSTGLLYYFINKEVFRFSSFFLSLLSSLLYVRPLWH
jgi:hypothetical protein